MNGSFPGRPSSLHHFRHDLETGPAGLFPSRQVMQWKKRIPPADWQHLVVVVRGPQMPLGLNILTQYFAKVTGERSHHLGYPLESRRLIYAEFIMQDRDELDLM